MTAAASPRGLLDWIGVSRVVDPAARSAPSIRSASSAAASSDSTLLRGSAQNRCRAGDPARQLAQLVADRASRILAGLELRVVVLERQTVRRRASAGWPPGRRSSTSSRSAKDGWEVMKSLIDAVAESSRSGADVDDRPVRRVRVGAERPTRSRRCRPSNVPPRRPVRDRADATAAERSSAVASDPYRPGDHSLSPWPRRSRAMHRPGRAAGSRRVERVRVQSATVQEDQCEIICGTGPFEVVDVDPVAGDHALGGQHQTRRIDSVPFGRRQQPGVPGGEGLGAQGARRWAARSQARRSVTGRRPTSFRPAMSSADLPEQLGQHFVGVLAVYRGGRGDPADADDSRR